MKNLTNLAAVSIFSALTYIFSDIALSGSPELFVFAGITLLFAAFSAFNVVASFAGRS